MDKSWINCASEIIHSLHTGGKHLAHRVVGTIFCCNILFLLVFKKLSTGIGWPNNNNKLMVSNIY